MRLQGPHHTRGFSLIEVLVSFVLLSLALTVILQIFSGALRGAAASERYAAAMVVANNRIAMLRQGPEIQPGTTAGVDGIYLWQLEITPSPLESTASASSAGPYQLLDVNLRVRWQQGGRTPQITLHTLRLAPTP